MKKLFFLILVATLVATSAKAQDEILFSDISMIDLGTGQIYGHKREDKNEPIDGKVRIIPGYATAYIDAEFDKGYATGLWKTYQDNKLMQEQNFADGYLEGESIEYYIDGSEKRKIQFSKNKVNGKSIGYYSDGKVEQEVTMKNGVMDGYERLYREDGEMWNETNYVDGKPEGKSVMKVRGSSANYTQTQFYKNGMLHGEYSEIYEDGVAKTKGSYKEGQKNGNWNTKREDGTPRLSEVYYMGDQIGKTTYYTNGNKEKEYNYLKGKQNGSQKQYGLDGTLKQEHNYVNGKQVGKQITHMTSNAGNYVETATYNERGQKHGDFSEIFAENKAVKSKGKYVNNQKDGKWVYGTIRGLTKEDVYKSGVLETSKKIETKK